MFTEEFRHEAREEEFPEFQDPFNGGGEVEEEEEEEEDTLSLCDLPIYGGEAQAADFWESHDSSLRKSLGSSSSSSSSSYHSYDEEDGFFEFSSPLKAQEPDNIVFCGKLIPYKKEQSPDNPGNAQAFKGVSMPPLEKYVKPATKVSGVKPKWYLLAFGLARFPGHMEMRDIKKRQTKRMSSSSNPTSCGSKTNDRDGGQGEMVKADRNNGNKGLWALLRVIGCTGQSANSVVKASFGCVPKI